MMEFPLTFSETNFMEAQKSAFSGYKSHGILEIHHIHACGDIANDISNFISLSQYRQLAIS